MSSLWRLCNTQWRRGKGEQTRERRRVREGQDWPAEKERYRHGKEKRGEDGLMKGRGEGKGEQRGIQVKEIWDGMRQKERGRHPVGHYGPITKTLSARQWAYQPSFHTSLINWEEWEDEEGK